MKKPECIVLRSPAKLNLTFDILGRRADGYHEIHGLVTPISLYDTITLALVPPGGGTATAVRFMGAPGVAGGIDSGDNLATRAAALFHARAGRRNGCRISIEKRIPVGGGLGGGSADAAAVLIGLNALYGRPFDRTALARMGAVIGADVPPLVWGGAVWIAGKGERIAPLRGLPRKGGPAFWFVLLNPGFAVATADIYRRRIPGLTLSDRDYKRTGCVFASGDVPGLAEALRNDLQAAAFAKYPALELLAGALREAGARKAMLAGSGGTVFGLADSRADALRIRRRAVGMLETAVWSRVVKTVPDGVTVAHGPLEARV